MHHAPSPPSQCRNHSVDVNISGLDITADRNKADKEVEYKTDKNSILSFLHGKEEIFEAESQSFQEANFGSSSSCSSYDRQYW